MNIPKEHMRNIGPKSAALLAEAGIKDLDDLKEIGVDGAMDRLRMLGYSPSKNMEHALHGALLNKDWRDVAQDRK